jgi:spectinomycin phosphotransferase
MRSLPDELETSALPGLLADGWGFDVAAAEYAAVGGGSYHWVVHDGDGARRFVTVDDLDHKPWLGDTRKSVFDGLSSAFETAAALRDSGLGFVVAPIRDVEGATVRSIGLKQTIALFPFVAGRAGEFGRFEPAERAALLAMIAELHQATPAVASVARSIDLDVPGRPLLEAALQELDQTWSGGPFSEPARQALAPHAADIAELLALSDRLSDDVRRSSDWVVTHGEPHAGNVMWTGERHVLVDWDTVALAPPERDLWMLVGDTADTNDVASSFFRLRWDLSDLAAFTHQLRSPHRHSEDTVKAFDALTYYVAIRDRWAALL